MRFFILRLARFINGFVANVIAQRERQAQLTVLRSLNDRDLMDIGLNRCEIGEGLAEAAKARSLWQQSRKQMPLPFDPLREAILLELNSAICARRAQGVSFDALERDYGLSKEVLYLIAGHNDRNLEERVTTMSPVR